MAVVKILNISLTIVSVFLKDPEAIIQSPHENCSLHAKNFALNSPSHGKKK